jgi:hypothetical protein
MSSVLQQMPQAWPGLVGNLPGIYTGEYPPEYGQYNTQFPGQKEVIQWTWYDTQTYTSGTTTTLTFFTNGPGGRSADLTNMDVAGQLAAPKAFLLRAPRFFIKQRPRSVARAAAAAVQTGAIDNVSQLINTGVYSVTIGSKNYAVFPLWLLTAGGGAYGFPALEGATADPGGYVDFGQNGIPDARNIFTLSKPQFIAPQINFSVTLTWPAAITLAGGDTSLSILWDGDLIRPVQ